MPQIDSNRMSFEECFKKHFPMSYQMQLIMANANDFEEEGTSFEESLLKQVRFYDGTYEIEESLMGAFIMHVALGNISGWNINELLINSKLSNGFIDDVIKNLMHIVNHDEDADPGLDNHHIQNYTYRNNNSNNDCYEDSYPLKDFMRDNGYDPEYDSVDDMYGLD